MNLLNFLSQEYNVSLFSHTHSLKHRRNAHILTHCNNSTHNWCHMIHWEKKQCTVPYCIEQWCIGFHRINILEYKVSHYPPSIPWLEFWGADAQCFTGIELFEYLLIQLIAKLWCTTVHSVARINIKFHVVLYNLNKRLKVQYNVRQQ